MSVDRNWDGRCEWCGGMADDRVSDMGCHCVWCANCGEAPAVSWGDLCERCAEPCGLCGGHWADGTCGCAADEDDWVPAGRPTETVDTRGLT